MRAKYAAQIRAGIQRARDVHARRRQHPQWFVPMHDHARKSLFQRAYEHEQTAMVRDGRIKPPRGGSGISRPCPPGKIRSAAGNCVPDLGDGANRR